MPQGSSRPPLASKAVAHAKQNEALSDAGDISEVDAINVSRYVADICGELSKMTKSTRLMMLSYLLAMVRQEAERVARGGPQGK